MQKYTKLTNPDYLFCELPIKNDSIDDNRIFIYCVKYLSLIEVWPYDIGFAAWPKTMFQKNYSYGSEDFLLVFTQNNIELAMEGKDKVKTESQIMDEAWSFFKDYLIWEDSQ